MGEYCHTAGFNYRLFQREIYDWNPEAFIEIQEIDPEVLQIQDPTNLNCGLCHGLVHDNVEDPLVTLGCSPERWSTITTGQIISPQKMADSGMNLANKEPWTVPGMCMPSDC